MKITISETAQTENGRLHLYSLLSVTSHVSDLLCSGKCRLQTMSLYYPGVLTTEAIVACCWAHWPRPNKRRHLGTAGQFPSPYGVVLTVYRYHLPLSWLSNHYNLIRFPIWLNHFPLRLPSPRHILPNKSFSAFSFYYTLHKMYTMLMNHHLKLINISFMWT